MSQLLTLSRAARLVGVTRGVLQQKIRSGELQTFEGQLRVTDLLRAYPNAKMEDTTMLERVEKIKEDAKYVNVPEPADLPSPDVLEARLIKLSQEFIKLLSQLDKYREFLDTLASKLRTALELTDTTLLRTEIDQLQHWVIAERQEQPLADKRAQLLAKDTFLRLIAAHIKLIPSGHEFFVRGNDSILEAALRVGLSLNYGCTSGNCGLCKARILSGDIRKIRPHDYTLSEAEKGMGYALLCSNTAITDLVIEAAEANSVADIPLQKVVAKVRLIKSLADDLLMLHIQTPRTQTLRFIAGQSVTLTLEKGISAEYPLASCPCDGRNLQFYMRKNPHDKFTQAVFTTLKSHHDVTVEGPTGQFVLKEDSTAPALFLAHDDGIAPIKSLIEQALALDTVESIHLYWIVSQADGHYLHNLCRAWEDALDNFHYYPLMGEFDKKLAEITFTDLELCEIYVAGSESFVTSTDTFLQQHGVAKERLHLNKLPLTDILQR